MVPIEAMSVLMHFCLKTGATHNQVQLVFPNKGLTIKIKARLYLSALSLRDTYPPKLYQPLLNLTLPKITIIKTF